ncbi:MAG: hypothetical protein RL398_759 [Planctomycetota bacterium]|jgi:HEAT repeat protein
MLAALLSGLLLWQDPTPAPTPAPTPKVEAPAAIEAWDDRTAKAAVAEFEKVMKGKGGMGERTRALEVLGKGSNKLLVKPLAKVIETEKSVLVRQKAAVVLAAQPQKEANEAIRKLLKNARVGSEPALLGELVKALSNCGYEAQQWQEIAGLFEQEYAANRVTLQEAILDLVARHKEKQAVPMLLRNLDEPAPKDPHDPSNPPAEYWEARWKAWSGWRGKVKQTLFALTGQNFTRAAEAEEWLKKNPL